MKDGDSFSHFVPNDGTSVLCFCFHLYVGNLYFSLCSFNKWNVLFHGSSIKITDSIEGGRGTLLSHTPVSPHIKGKADASTVQGLN